MAKRNWALVGSAVMAACCALAGCASPEGERAPQTSAPAAESLSEGLTVLASTTDTALNVAFKRDNAVIYIQALRGKLAPADYQPPGAAPVYEVDARFVSEDGRSFYTRRGGDEWIDPSWATDLERQTNLAPTRVSNEKLFELAAEATTLLDVELPKRLDADKLALHVPELQAIRAFGSVAVPTFGDTRVRFNEHLAKVGREVVTEIPYGSDKGGTDTADRYFGGNYYYMAVWDAGIDWTNGRHSATRLHAWSGYWVAVHDSCNHGRCPGESDMGVKCNANYFEALEDYKPQWVLQSCKTGYHSFSNDGHNCHDDTRVQLANFVYGKTNNGYQAWCGDGDSSTDISGGFEQNGSPECTGYQRKGYNHPSWCGYDGGGNSCPSSWQGDGICDCNCRFPDGTGADPDCRNR